MKRLLILTAILVLAACMPAPLTLVPVDTIVAQTMQAIPKTDTPIPTSTNASTSTPTLEPYSPTPEINQSAPGAYCIPTNTERRRALVTRVLDGERIEVVAGNDTLRVRYIGIDAPNLTPTIEWQAPLAIGTNDRFVGGKYVTLVKDTSETDAEGFYLRYVLVDDLFVNYELVRQGLARALPTPPDLACQTSFLAAQTEAQATVRGVWQPTPLPTWTATSTATETPIATNTLPPTNTKPAPCVCRPTSCSAFYTQEQAQSCYDYCLDNGYGPVLDDKNNNGRVCEGLP
jgi:endonuclease YncB( thermonuclease family)